MDTTSEIQTINDHYTVPFRRVLFNNKNRGMEIIKCIMEILHNAIDADAKNIIIKILSDTDDNPVKLFIYNDGKEIQKDEIDKILVNGYTTRNKNETNVQGKFGVGAPLASQNLSNKTTITSKNKEEYHDCIADWIDMVEKNTNIPYTKESEVKNKELYQKLGDKGVLFTFEALTQIVTKYTKNQLEEIFIRCIKNAFFDLGNKFVIKINDIVIDEHFDIIAKSANSCNSISVPIFHYKKGREYISIFDEKKIGGGKGKGKKESSYVTYRPKRTPQSKEILDNDRDYKFCGKSLAIGCRISKEKLEEEVNFWKSCSHYQDIKYDSLSGSTFVRNNVSLNQNMERLKWDNKDFGDDQIRWKLVWNNNEDLDIIYGIQTVKSIHEDTKKNCDENFRWTLKAIKTRGRSYINMLMEKVKVLPDNKIKSENIMVENEKNNVDSNNSEAVSESSETESQIKIKKKRKDFSKNIQESGLKKNDNRCYITGAKLRSDGKEGAIREDDHYDGNSSNNSLENYHPITLWAHKVKTRDQNNIIYYQNRGDIEAKRESTRHFENNINGGYQKLHIKEIGYALESLNSTFIDNNGNERNYKNYEEDIIELYTKALKEINPELKKKILLNLK